ncbi:MAG: hypothetical protein ACOX9B_00915 [Candidatus Xenobium sp.]|jgi:hypothetical protein
MPQIFGSYNSRFFAVLRDGRLALFRGAAPLWTRPVASARKLIRVGNQGDVFFLTDRGVTRLPLSRDSEMEPIEALDQALAAEEEGEIGSVRINAEGTEICIEQISTSARLSRKLLRLLRRGESTEMEPQVDCHELLLFNRNTGALRKFCRTDIDIERSGRFWWTASPNLAFLLVGVPGVGRKPTIAFKVIHTREESIYSEFEMKVPEISNLWVTETGTVLLEIRVSPREAYLVLTTLEGEKMVMNPPPNYRVLNLGQRNVTLWTGPNPQVVIKDFSDKTICQADLAPLDRLGLRYEFLFNDRGGLDLVTLKGRELRVNHTDSETLAVDARRWGVLAQQQESAELETVQWEEKQRRKDEEKTRRQEERSRELANALAPEARTRDLSEILQTELPIAEVEEPPVLEPEMPAVPTGRSLPEVEEDPFLTTEMPAVPMEYSLPEVAEDPFLTTEMPAVPTGRSLPEVEAELEKLRMSYVSGVIQRAAYHQRAEELQAELAALAAMPTAPREEPVLEERPDVSAPPPVPVLQVEPTSYDNPLPAKTAQPRPIWSGSEEPGTRQLDLREFERRKVERLLEALEGRLARNEISEATYRELKARYLKRQAQV